MTTKTTEYIGANGWGSLSLSELVPQKLKWSLLFSSRVLKPRLAAFSHFPKANMFPSSLTRLADHYPHCIGSLMVKTKIISSNFDHKYKIDTDTDTDMFIWF